MAAPPLPPREVADPRPATRVNRSPHSMVALFKVVKSQDQGKGGELADVLQELAVLKKKITLVSKRSFTLEKDIRNLDKKIALLIRNRITMEEATRNEGEMDLIAREASLKNKREKELYGKLFYILQQDTAYTSRMVRLISLAEIDNLLQTVMFTLYGNQYDDMEEHLLLSMFRTVLIDEFKDAPGLGSVLRANTPLTRMMTTYTRRGPGQHYLKNMLDKPISDFITRDSKLEVNPLKVYTEYIDEYEIRTGKKSELNRKVTAEEAAENPEVQKLVAPRYQELDEITYNFVTAMIESLDEIPYGIRWICKQIRDLVMENFPDAGEQELCSLIGGFYLLRFVNPAIVTPQTVMMVDTKLSNDARRNLTLLAKILQNLANNVQFGGMKEAYMAPLNSCLERNHARLNQFFMQMVDVPDLEQQLSFDKYLALAKTGTSEIVCSLNELYFLHKLLQDHQDEVIPDEADPLRRLLKDLGTAPAQLARKDNANVDLTLINPAEDNGHLAKNMSRELTPEQLYGESKFLLFYIVRTLPVEEMMSLQANKRTVKNTITVAKRYAQEAKDKTLEVRCKKLSKNLKSLIKMGVIEEGDNYAQLRRDTFEELADYELQLERFTEDLVKLREVLATVQKHCEFLQNQRDMYILYLEDVRAKCDDPKGKGKASGKSSRSSRGKEPASLPEGVNGMLGGEEDAPPYPRMLGPYKRAYLELEKDGLIKESSVPKDKHPHITFYFTSTAPGLYSVQVKYRKLSVVGLDLRKKDLMDLKEKGQHFESEYVTLETTLLLHLLNKLFNGK